MHRRTVAISLGAAVLAFSCAKQHGEAHAPDSRIDKDSEGCIPDPDDACRAFTDGCPHPDEGTDGCPEDVLDLTGTCQLSDANLPTVQRIVKEIRDRPRLTTLGIVARTPGCGDAVRQALVGAGVEAGKLVVVLRAPDAVSNVADAGHATGSPSAVGFAVAAWDGSPCKP
jgi:hypothetical protein